MTRQQTLQRWALGQLKNLGHTDIQPSWQPLVGDASFRHFYRLGLPELHASGGEAGNRSANRSAAETSFIVMDAPPESENNHQFLALSEKFRRAGIRVPEVLAADLDEGFLLVTDFGDDLYARLYRPQDRPHKGRKDPHRSAQPKGFSHRLDIDAAMEQALRSLLKIQLLDLSDGIVPAYTRRRFEEELNLFQDWFLAGLLQIDLDLTTQKLLQQVWQILLEAVTQQPQVCVHRDYHSRNLLRGERGETLIVDFQDALVGPITYDLVSLLRDCYVRFEQEFIEDWQRKYLADAQSAQLLTDIDPATFTTWFDLTGIQRQLKAVGIFSRLMLRDGRPSHLSDIEPVLAQLIDVSCRYPALQRFSEWLLRDIAPRTHLRLASLPLDSDTEDS